MSDYTNNVLAGVITIGTIIFLVTTGCIRIYCPIKDKEGREYLI